MDKKTATIIVLALLVTILTVAFAYYIVENVLRAPVHDVMLTDIEVSPNQPSTADTLNIAVVARNKGNLPETFDVVVHLNESNVARQTVVNIEPSSERTLLFSLNVRTLRDSGLGGENYTIKCIADTVQGETYTSDNTCTYGVVSLGYPRVSDYLKISYATSLGEYLPNYTNPTRINIENLGVNITAVGGDANSILLQVDEGRIADPDNEEGYVYHTLLKGQSWFPEILLEGAIIPLVNGKCTVHIDVSCHEVNNAHKETITLEIPQDHIIGVNR